MGDTGVRQLTSLTRYGGLTPTIPDMLDSSTYLLRLEPDAVSMYHASDDSMTWTSKSGTEGESVAIAALASKGEARLTWDCLPKMDRSFEHIRRQVRQRRCHDASRMFDGDIFAN